MTRFRPTPYSRPAWTESSKMTKKQLKKRIKELEFENEILRAMRPYPIYYQVYGGDASNVRLQPEEVKEPIETAITFDYNVGGSQDCMADLTAYIQDVLVL